jgi:beta-phosphoglucomutase
MLKALIFDMDGVIIDSHPAHRHAWRAFLESLGKSVSDVELDFVLDGRKRDEILCHFLGNLSKDKIRKYGEQKDKFLREQALAIEPIPGVVDFLSKAREAGLATAVATSASETRTRRVLDELSLVEKFDVMSCGNEVRRGKPNPAIYRLTCQKLGIGPKWSVAIEDAVSGVRAARTAGLMCIAIAEHQFSEILRAAGATHVARNFLELSVERLQAMVRN